MTPRFFDGPVVFVDVETTGGHPAYNRVIEIGVVMATGPRLELEWSSLVNPGASIPPSIQHFTGITDEMVRHAPFFEDIIDEVASKLEGRLFVAHNARFDYGFVRHEFRRVGRKFSSRVACTVKLSRRLHPEMPRHNLDAVIERHGLHCDQRHRALADAQALWQFWSVLREQRTVDEIEQVLASIVQLTSLPPHLPADLADRMPEAPGVYRFYGANDALLYVGKAKNVRQRVLSHWQGAARDSKSQRLAELTRHIDWIETAGELGALLLEARLVRELKPLYNRKLRGAAQIYTWIIADDGGAPRLAPLDHLQLSFEGGDAFGLFRNEKAARKTLLAVAREKNLCLKVLGLEAARGSCFAYQLGRCAGACVGEEPLPRHGLRLKLALASQRVKSWPHPGPIGIREVGENDLEQVHVIDEWRHVATLQEGDELPSRPGRLQPFDLDVYQILLRYLSSDEKPRLMRLPATENDGIDHSRNNIPSDTESCYGDGSFVEDASFGADAA